MISERHELREVTIHGHTVAYREAGGGPVVLLVHGMAGSSATWRYVLPALAERYTVVAPDLPGHGRSAKPRGDYSLGAYASSLRDLLVALGHERATVVGQSLGGGIAMQFAYQFPERCDRLALVSSGGLGQEVNLLLRALTLPGAEYVLPLACTQWMHGAGTTAFGWLRNIGLRPSRRLVEVWESYGSLADAEARTAFVHTLRSVIDQSGQRVSATDRLYLAAHVPTLVVWGAKDAIIPVQQAYDAHDALVGSTLEIFDDCGHFPHCEEPERFVEVLERFITSHAPAALGASEWQAVLKAASS